MLCCSGGVLTAGERSTVRKTSLQRGCLRAHGAKNVKIPTPIARRATIAIKTSMMRTRPCIRWWYHLVSLSFSWYHGFLSSFIGKSSIGCFCATLNHSGCRRKNLLRLAGGHSRSKTPCAEVVFCPRVSQPFSRSALAVIMLPWVKWSDNSTEVAPGETSTVCVEIDRCLVRRLIAGQFPHWAQLPVKPVVLGGWDNRTFHLGHDMTVRLPQCRALRSASRERAALVAEACDPFDPGSARHGRARPWLSLALVSLSVARRRSRYHRTDRQFALSLAEYLLALQRVDPAGGPGPGPHNFYRG